MVLKHKHASFLSSENDLQCAFPLKGSDFRIWMWGFSPFIWISCKKYNVPGERVGTLRESSARTSWGGVAGVRWAVGFGDEAGVAGEGRATDLRTLPNWKMTSEMARPRSLTFPLIILPQGK